MPSYYCVLLFAVRCLCSSVDRDLIDAGYTFGDYVREFRRSYAPEEFPRRQLAVERTLRRITAHNALADRRWDATVNEFTDWTDEELQRLHGYDKVQGLSSTVLSQLNTGLTVDALPDSLDWRKKGVITAVKEQHGCQGCWAFSAVESIESALAISGEPLVELSVEELISCTPNPEKCGGSGGCGGATAEQAFNFSRISGLTTETNYPWKWSPFKSHTCDESKVRQPAAAVGGFVRLPANDAQALMTALVQNGPIVVTVSGTSWMLYDKGIFDGELGMGCGTDLNHQVSLIGYGAESGTNYWLVRNSYGPKWGEQGYIRVLRAASGQKEQCGSDSTPTDGYCGNAGWCACPKSITVCGVCGILADSSYPTNVRKWGATNMVV